MILILCRYISIISRYLYIKGALKIKNPRKILSENIKSIRKSQNISQEKLGEMTNLHRTYIGGVERSERNISIDNINKISEALNVPCYILFKENDE